MFDNSVLENRDMGFLEKILGPPTKQKFATMLIFAFDAAGDSRSVRFDEPEFRLAFEEDSEDCGILNLSNLYVEFCKVEKTDRQRCLKEMVRAALSHLKEMPEEFADAGHDIRPRLWNRSTFEQLRLQQQIEGGKSVDWPLEPIGEHLYLSLVYDLPEAVRSISNEDLENWGVSFWEARELAVQNLAETKFVYASVGDELYASNTGDSYDATRLILSELFDDFKIEGRPIAMIPNRDTLLVTGTGSEVGQKMMLEFALQQLQEQPRPMIATPLILEHDGQWVDWFPPLESPLFEEYQRLRLGWMQVEYADQKQLLEKIYEFQQNDDFVADFNVFEKEGVLKSYCEWTPGIKAILPKTDLIMFPDQLTKTAKGISWEQAKKHVSDMLDPLDVYPPRYRVIDHPDEIQLQQMGAQVF